MLSKMCFESKLFLFLPQYHLLFLFAVAKTNGAVAGGLQGAALYRGRALSEDRHISPSHSHSYTSLVWIA